MDDGCLWSHTGALGRGEAGCFPMEVAGLWEPGPKVLGVSRLQELYPDNPGYAA